MTSLSHYRLPFGFEFTSYGVVAYKRCWYLDPYAHISIHDWSCSDALTGRDRYLQQKLGETRTAMAAFRAQGDDGDEIKPAELSRIDSINTAALFSRSGDANSSLEKEHIARFYEPPAPSPAISLELLIRLSQIRIPGMAISIMCDSHEERIALANHIAADGVFFGDMYSSGVPAENIRRSPAIEIGRGAWRVVQISLVDREVIYRETGAARVARCGSELPSDQLFTEQMRPLIDQLTKANDSAAA